MKYSIVYSSRTGNTKLLADTIIQELPQGDCIYFGAINDKALEADRIFVGFWTDNGVCNEETGDFLKKLGKHEVFLFGTAGLGSSIDYFDKIIHRTRAFLPEKSRFIGSFMCQGKMPMALKERYIKMKNEHNNIPNLDRMIENFNIALSHPDKSDLNNLRNWMRTL